MNLPCQEDVWLGQTLPDFPNQARKTQGMLTPNPLRLIKSGKQAFIWIPEACCWV